MNTSSDISSGTLSVCSPYDRSEIETLPLVGWEAADRALQLAEAAFADKNQQQPAWQRADWLKHLAGKVESEKDEFAYLIAREGGKPISDARIEVNRAILGIRYAASHIDQALSGEVISSDLSQAGQVKHMHTTRSAIGVVVAISAFNHPLNLLVHQMVPAIAVGAPVIIKPSLETPLTCKRLVELVHESGVPANWCQMVLCDNETSEKLATDPRVAFLSFIGSAKVGWHLRSQIAAGTRCALEHGGNAPVIILPYTNQDAAIPTLLRGGMSHAGQVCVSVQRVYAPWAEVGHFARKLGEAAERLRVGNPVHDEVEVGPLITPQAVERVELWVKEAVGGGAKLMCGGAREADTLYQPTILLDAPDNAKVTKDEIFGPVICVYGYDEVEDAITRANDSDYSFQAAVWGREQDRIAQAIDGLDAATVMVNDHSAFRVDWMPFGGHKQSGLGVGGLLYTMRDYTKHKLVVS